MQLSIGGVLSNQYRLHEDPRYAVSDAGGGSNPASGGTEGGEVLTITGANFGCELNKGVSGQVEV